MGWVISHLPFIINHSLVYYYVRFAKYGHRNIDHCIYTSSYNLVNSIYISYRVATPKIVKYSRLNFSEKDQESVK